MGKKEKAIYAPGELDKVRGRLGNLNPEEAKRMAQLLGGEVGVERAKAPAAPVRRSRARSETVDARAGTGGRGSHASRHRVEAALEGSSDGETSKKPKKGLSPEDNPAVPIKLSYRERVKMDKYAGQTEFEIKNPIQVLHSMLSLFGEPVDYVNSSFITRRLDEYYKRIESLVTSTRNIFPRNNLRRNEQLKKASPFAYAVLDTIRYWNIERITSEMARLQSHPRNVKTVDLSDILRAIYKPLYVLDLLDFEKHIKESYKLLYKVIYLENTEEAKKYQEMIRSSLSAFNLIRNDIHYLMYPLLLRLLSDRWIPYESFFSERRNRLRAFLNVTDTDQINPAMAIMAKSGGVQEDQKDEEGQEEKAEESEGENREEDEAEKARKAAAAAERKAVDRGLGILETMFPKAGWDNFPSRIDLYPYFADVFNWKKEYALIAPTDSLQVVAVLIRILEELFFGIRFVSFGTIMGADGNPERVEDTLTPIINNWHYYNETSFEKEYLPRLSEYCRILINASDSRTSNYAKRLVNELYWVKRLYFLPYFKFESSFPPPFQKKDVTSLYPEIRMLRKYLTAVANGIEQGIKRGGMERKAPCDGVDNPWEPYVFQVPNPVSIRLNALLDEKKRNNATLIFYTLAITVVLDYLVNNDESWAYGDERGSILFRSEDGMTPLLGVDKQSNTEALFKQSLKQKKET